MPATSGAKPQSFTLPPSAPVRAERCAVASARRPASGSQCSTSVSNAKQASPEVLCNLKSKRVGRDLDDFCCCSGGTDLCAHLALRRVCGILRLGEGGRRPRTGRHCGRCRTRARSSAYPVCGVTSQ
jgi:hypothetical protein